MYSYIIVHLVNRNNTKLQTTSKYNFIELISFKSLHYKQHDEGDGELVDHVDKEVGEAVSIVNHVGHLISQVQQGQPHA